MLAAPEAPSPLPQQPVRPAPPVTPMRRREDAPRQPPRPRPKSPRPDAGEETPREGGIDVYAHTAPTFDA